MLGKGIDISFKAVWMAMCGDQGAAATDSAAVQKRWMGAPFVRRQLHLLHCLDEFHTCGRSYPTVVRWAQGTPGWAPLHRDCTHSQVWTASGIANNMIPSVGPGYDAAAWRPLSLPWILPKLRAPLMWLHTIHTWMRLPQERIPRVQAAARPELYFSSLAQ